MTPGRGRLIVVEGLDRSGKTSQCQLLVDSMRSQGRKVRYIKFPDRSTPTGQMINTYLTGSSHQDDHSIHLIFSANRWEASSGILEDLANGTTVVVDRYSYSGAVYSAAKDIPDLTLEWAWMPEIGLPKPDLTVFLDISADDAAGRGGYGLERYETQQMQARVRALFGDLFARIDGLDLTVIDAGRGLQDVARDVLGHVTQCLDRPEAEVMKLGPLKSGHVA